MADQTLVCVLQLLWPGGFALWVLRVYVLAHVSVSTKGTDEAVFGQQPKRVYPAQFFATALVTVYMAVE